MQLKSHIPNFITLMNLLAGVFSIHYVIAGDLQIAGALIFLAAILDFFDGFLARMLHAGSPIGGQLDSLADVVSFGVAPSLILYGTIKMVMDNNDPDFLPYFALFVPLFSAYRLAKFNLDEEQKGGFKGLPTPATGILLASFPIMIQVCLADNPGLYYDIVTNPYVLAATAVVVSFLMVSNLPMFAMKFSSPAWGENQTRYIFIILSVFLLLLLRLAAIPLIVLMYLLLSLLTAGSGPGSDKNKK
jgi:CDP-diacylglycerol--serine O-phosphatidyltransferase